MALNYDSEATEEDDSCEYEKQPIVVAGCMDELALNYNSEATEDDESCLSADLSPEALAQGEVSTSVGTEEDEYEEQPIVVAGCMDELALNYNTEATEEDGSCSYPEPVVVTEGEDMGVEASIIN